MRLEDGEWCGGRWELTQTEIGDYKSDCLASDVSPLRPAKV